MSAFFFLVLCFVLSFAPLPQLLAILFLRVVLGPFVFCFSPSFSCIQLSEIASRVYFPFGGCLVCVFFPSVWRHWARWFSTCFVPKWSLLPNYLPLSINFSALALFHIPSELNPPACVHLGWNQSLCGFCVVPVLLMSPKTPNLLIRQTHQHVFAARTLCSSIVVFPLLYPSFAVCFNISFPLVFFSRG